VLARPGASCRASSLQQVAGGLPCCQTAASVSLSPGLHASGDQEARRLAVRIGHQVNNSGEQQATQPERAVVAALKTALLRGSTIPGRP